MTHSFQATSGWTMGSKPQHLCQNQGPPTELVGWAFLWLWLQWVEDERIQSVNSREDIGLGSGSLMALSATDLACSHPRGQFQ